MTNGATIADDDIDAPADAEIANCLTLSSPRSFFLFAGAGSGKTRSLVTALNHVRAQSGAALKLKGQRIGVITFTNAASNEIKSRLAFDPLIDVSTIHSFAWSLISGLNRDIREYLRGALAADIKDLEELEARGRRASAASANRRSKIKSKSERLASLDQVRKFVYSPTSDNRGRDALSHAEVIEMTSSFLERKATMQHILVGRYPFLLIDESQDTNKKLIDALLAVQAGHKDRFALGLLGDMMQRIYNEGKDGLGQGLPPDWATPGKQMNHRCPRRVVTLINKVRSSTDGQVQRWRSDSIEGIVRLFILPGDTADKPGAERLIAQHMTTVTSDDKWRDPKACKILTLEHRMAARRMNFLEMFVPLYDVDSWRTSLLEGELPAARFFSAGVLPLVQARQRNDSFAVARIAKSLSPLMSMESLRAAMGKKDQLKKVSRAIDQLMALWKDGADPSLLGVLRSVAATNLLVVPDSLQAALQEEGTDADDGNADVDERQANRAAAIRTFLAAPFSQVEPFATYMAGKAHFDTHQGVKGLEFDRVMVIMDDGEARGFLFKYENLFSGKGVGDPSVEGTRRLFYVTCSRAKKSLALVAYTDDPARVYQFVLRERWCDANEIVIGIPPVD